MTSGQVPAFQLPAADMLLDDLEVGVSFHEVTGGDAVFVNETACRLLGSTREELLGRVRPEAVSFLLPDGRLLSDEELPVRRCTVGGPVSNVLLFARRAGSEHRALRVSARLVSHAPASSLVLVTWLDVTEEYRKLDDEQAAREAGGQLYASVLRAMSEGVVVHDPAGRIRFCNLAAERILGLSTQQMVGLDAIDPRWALTRGDGSRLPPEEIPSEETRLTGRPVSRRHLVVARPDGSRSHLLVSTDPVWHPLDCQPWVVASFEDITAQEKARAALEVTAERLAAVTNAVPGVLLQYELAPAGDRGRYVFVSGETERLFGVSPAEILAGDNVIAERIFEADHARVVSQSLEAIRTGRPMNLEFRVRRGDEVRWCRSRAEARRSGDVTVVTSVIIDITEEKQLEEGLRRVQRSEVLGELAAGIAHNFNNMLSVVLANLEEARRGAEDPSGLLDDALLATRRSVELVRQLMRLARGEPAPAPGVAELNAAVEEVARLCRRTFDAGIEVVTAPAPAPVEVHADPSQLQQALVNLAVNARDAMEGRPRRRLTLTVLDGEKPGVEVRDTGVGISGAHLERLGELFFTTKPPTKGTGLGLATVRAMVREVDGAMRVTSVPGEGSVFTLEFKRAARASSSPPHRAPARLRERQLRVLVVDDEPLLRRALSRLLVTQVESVGLAASGDEALAMLESAPSAYDVVLLDLSMPGLSGREVLARLTARWPDLPVVVLSGHVGDREGLASAFDVLEKPIGLQQLTAVLARLHRR